MKYQRMVLVGLLAVGALACGETDGEENIESEELGEPGASGKGDDIGSVESDPCENTTQGSFGHEVEPVARCVAVIDGAIDGAELEVIDADVCLARGTTSRDSLHTRAGDRLYTFEGNLTVGSADYSQEMSVETTVFPTLLDEGEQLTDDEHTLAFNDRRVTTDLFAKDTELEEAVVYDVASQTLEYIQQYKEDRLLFDRWESRVHFRLDCTPYE